MSPRYRVTLSEQERKELEDLTKRGKTHARRFIHARALLLSDAGDFGSPWNVADTAEALGVSCRTIEHLKKRFVEEGIEAALDRKPREKPPREVTFSDEGLRTRTHIPKRFCATRTPSGMGTDQSE